LRSEKEHVIWSRFTRARANFDWRNLDLIFLAKIVKMKADICKAQVELGAVVMMVENKRDTQIANSLMSDTKNSEKQQRTIIRSMSLNQTAHDPRTVDGTA
tara:strand:- start:158 stop:460 length:303 start_codon:yes stop_codon:yes gene_type:complete